MFLFEEYDNKPIENNSTEMCIKHIYKTFKDMDEIYDISLDKSLEDISLNLTLKNDDDIIEKLCEKLAELNQYTYSIKSISENEEDRKIFINVEFKKKYGSEIPNISVTTPTSILPNPVTNAISGILNGEIN